MLCLCVVLTFQVKRQQQMSGSIRKLNGEDNQSQSQKPVEALSKMEPVEDGDGVTYKPVLSRPTFLTSHGLDRLARIVYPVAFIIFNFGYWIFFLFILPDPVNNDG